MLKWLYQLLSRLSKYELELLFNLPFPYGNSSRNALGIHQSW
jgi:hypothetical protein